MTRSVEFNLQPSVTAQVVFVIVPLIVAVLVIALPIDSFMTTCLLLALVLNMMWYRTRAYRIASLKYLDGEWLLRNRDTANETPGLLRTSAVLPGVVRLSFQTEGETLTQLVFRDSLTRAQWRVLHQVVNGVK